MTKAIAMSEITISKPLHKVLTHLTGEERIDVALPLAAKDLLKLKLRENEQLIKEFENRYKIGFEEFKASWEHDGLNDKYSYQVEKDYWEWEAAITDQKHFLSMLEELA